MATKEEVGKVRRRIDRAGCNEVATYDSSGGINRLALDNFFNLLSAEGNSLDDPAGDREERITRILTNWTRVSPALAVVIESDSREVYVPFDNPKLRLNQ